MLGKDSPSIKAGRVATIQTLSGTGGLGLGMIFIKRFMPAGTKVYISDPSWANHKNIAAGNDLEYVLYKYYNKATGGLDYDGFKGDLEAAPEGSVILLHVCAHNPTGVDLNRGQWEEIRGVMEKRKLVPFFDCAYQGFATGDLDGDAFAVQMFDKAGMEMMITQSYSKNFGLYGERCGALSFVTDSADTVKNITSQMSRIVRQNYSNPPRHGAQIVATVLKEPAYFKEWSDQLQVMVDRILDMRKTLHAELTALGTPGDWSGIITQIGMFSFTGLSLEQCERMMEKHHVYLLKNGRVSMCGLTTKNVKYVAAAIDEVVRALPKAPLNA